MSAAAKPHRSRIAWLVVTAAATLSPHAMAAAAPRAEVQINLCSDLAHVTSALLLEERGHPASVWLFDSANLDLHRKGQRLRLRERDGQAELTLKVAGQDCAHMDSAALGPDGKCETDVHGKSADQVVSLSRRVPAQEMAPLLAQQAHGGKPLAAALMTALDARQSAMLGDATSLPAGLLRLGPALVQAYYSRGQSFDVEVWTLPDHSQFVELSQKTRLDSAPTLQSQLLNQLARAGVQACADQDSQARVKLESLVRGASRG